MNKRLFDFDPDAYFTPTSQSDWESLSSSPNWLSKISGELSKKTGQLNDLVNALDYLSSATGDSDMMKKMVSTLAQLNKSQPTTQQQPTINHQSLGENCISTQNKASNDNAEDSDEVFQSVFNSPTIVEIVKEVMRKRK